MRITRHWRAALFVAAATTALACSGVPDDSKPIQAASSGAAAPAAAQSQAPAAPAATYAVPTAKDFQLTAKILEKECFGSAGCLIKYRIVLKQVNAKTFDPAKTYEITYSLKGTDSPKIGTLTVTGDQYSTDDYDRTGTKTSSAKITVVIDSIEES